MQPEYKKALLFTYGKPRRGWKGSISIYHKYEYIGISTRNIVDSAQDMDYWRVLVNEALNLRVPQAMELVTKMFPGYINYKEDS